jgi:hypothetical protein
MDNFVRETRMYPLANLSGIVWIIIQDMQYFERAEKMRISSCAE